MVDSNINDKKYKLCLFDTNALSSFLQNTEEWLIYYDKEFSCGETIICYSIFTLSELYYRQELFENYLTFFSDFPSLILDGHNSLFDKEIENYDKTYVIKPFVLAPNLIKGKFLSPKAKLKRVIRKSGFILKSDYWKEGRENILNGILELKKNYPPKGSKYTIKEIEFFNFSVSTSQIALKNRGFAERILESGKEINLDKFLSIRSTAYFVFYKFYPDKKKPTKSDVFDIMIASLLPYVDYFITEGNMSEIASRIKKNHNFLEGLKLYKLKDIVKLID